MPFILWLACVALGSWADSVLKATDNPEMARSAAKYPFIAILVLNTVCTRTYLAEHVVCEVLIANIAHVSID